MKRIIPSLVMFIVAFMLFSTVVYAWYALAEQNNVHPVSVSVVDSNVDLDVEYGQNGGGYTSFNTPAELNSFLDSMEPGDTIDVRVTISNNNAIGSPDSLISLELLNVRSSETISLYDLTDFFYLVNGTIELTWYTNFTEYSLGNYYQLDSISLTPHDPLDILYQGVNLETYRLSNLFNHYLEGEVEVVENNIAILPETPISAGHILVVTFSIGFDPYTPDQGDFQNGELLIDGLYNLIDQD